MSTQSSTYGDSVKIEKVEAPDHELNEIISQIHHYLFNFGHNWFFLFLGRSYFHKCCASWVHVSTHLDKFLQNPRNNYTLLMLVLENEIAKFPPQSFYGKKLKSLEQLVSMGLNFSVTSFLH
ncbi:MAG: hypothetical protein HYX61_08560 [Gammaproteobacteria bacterium]|jgi:hypothetical protein|nr:hypothetical protein [Gammaproteobacteria bacterium]